MTCLSGKYSTNGKCCDQCPAGQYVKDVCNATKSTVCATCKEGHFTATTNGLTTCHICRVCSFDNKQVNSQNCTTTADTVCECIPGYYCSNKNCDHCLKVTECPVGEGVKTPATRTSDTVCVECGNGTYSNVTDSISGCKPHIRCEDFGRELKTQGTHKADAICGNFIHNNCPWILPAGLWAGLVVTALILFAIVIYWRAKCRSYRSRSPSVPVTLVDMASAVKPLDLPLPDTKLNGHCQESCAMEDFKIPLFSQDENLVNCSMDSSLPITPLKVSVSFAEPDYINNGGGYCSSNFLRTHSEPQEDEWCGT
ncbi:tumor necrosis factor receptor superfamily member 14 [Anabas testudineus]|uniref:TNFR-Cys domain-containing protein n=1 Tax=Anabas testudineus TaxID=64144 RepID=A0A7N6FJC1_ANATE|nr:tumor necrosis factor receptor superfamily member 14 [Anabas testudineus]